MLRLPNAPTDTQAATEARLSRYRQHQADRRGELKFKVQAARNDEERARWFGRAPTPLETPKWRPSAPF